MTRRTVAERFWAKVDKTETCWLWTAALMDGYGWFRLHGKNARAHRVAYEMLVGPIPEGLMLDHLCRVRACVNPAHLEPVTNEENIRRGFGHTATHCAKGHEFTPENTWSYKTRGGWNYRRCRECRNEAQRKQRAAKGVAS